MGKIAEDKLKDLVIAHKVNIIRSAEELPLHPDNVSLPVIVENKNYIYGEKNILAYLESLKKVMADWDRFQSDACYVDDDVTTC